MIPLLADFVGAVSSGRGQVAAEPFAADGVSGRASWLALCASVEDRDDVDWQTLHHPGSVVWSTVLALGTERGCSGDDVVDAAYRGYATAATVADLLGPAHRRLWHVTATAGALGAAAAATVLLGLDESTRARALRLAAANLGGLSRAAVERAGAAGFNRAAAVGLGLLAARGAVAGAASVADPFTGPGGVIEAMAGGEDASARARSMGALRDGLDDAAPRLHPTSGFLQGVAAGVATARRQVPGDLEALTIEVAHGALALVDGSDERAWWNAQVTAIRAWHSGGAGLVDVPIEQDGSAGLVTVIGGDVPIGAARVTAVTAAGEVSVDARPPTGADSGLRDGVARKWVHLLGAEGSDVVDVAQAALSPTASLANLGGPWQP